MEHTRGPFNTAHTALPSNLKEAQNREAKLSKSLTSPPPGPSPSARGVSPSRVIPSFQIPMLILYSSIAVGGNRDILPLSTVSSSYYYV